MKDAVQAIICIFSIVTLAVRCAPDTHKQVMMENFPEFYQEGHRGTRGLMPENTIPSMKKAIEDGANVIELDIQISKDKQVLVAHDPYINRQFSLLPDGNEIPEPDAQKYLLYQMPYDSIRRFDVGSKFHPGFPEQKKIRTYIPLLGELIDSVEQFTAEKKYAPVIYNIEIKSNPEQDGFYQPIPSELIGLVMGVVNTKKIDNRFYIQSFDIRQIQEAHVRYPHVATGFLTSKKEVSIEENLENIGFTPRIYSPHFSLATKDLVENCHTKGMKFVPWTVNTLEEMIALKELGVDGIITDYPNLFRELQ